MQRELLGQLTTDIISLKFWNNPLFSEKLLLPFLCPVTSWGSMARACKSLVSDTHSRWFSSLPEDAQPCHKKTGWQISLSIPFHPFPSLSYLSNSQSNLGHNGRGCNVIHNLQRLRAQAAAPKLRSAREHCLGPSSRTRQKIVLEGHILRIGNVSGNGIGEKSTHIQTCSQAWTFCSMQEINPLCEKWWYWWSSAIDFDDSPLTQYAWCIAPQIGAGRYMHSSHCYAFHSFRT